MSTVEGSAETGLTGQSNHGEQHWLIESLRMVPPWQLPTVNQDPLIVAKLHNINP